MHSGRRVLVLATSVSVVALGSVPSGAAAGSTNAERSPVGDAGTSTPTWLQESEASSPGGWTETKMVYDAGRGEMVAFGGVLDGTITNDTWSWNGSTWRQLDIDEPPRERYRHAMAYDDVNDDIVMFGGWQQSDLGDTWLFTDGQWLPVQPPNAPHSRQGHMMAFDPALEQVILFGGAWDDDSYSDETWAWNGTSWTELHPVHSPQARTNGGLAYDPTRGALVLFGGYGGDLQFFGDTWTWDGVDWTRESPRRSPSPRGLAAMSTLGAHVTVYSGSVVSSRNVANRRTWVLHKKTWRKDLLSPTPGRRYASVLQWDPVRAEAVLFGGSDRFAQDLGDTWTLTP